MCLRSEWQLMWQPLVPTGKMGAWSGLLSGTVLAVPASRSLQAGRRLRGTPVQLTAGMQSLLSLRLAGFVFCPWKMIAGLA